MTEVFRTESSSAPPPHSSRPSSSRSTRQAYIRTVDGQELAVEVYDEPEDISVARIPHDEEDVEHRFEDGINEIPEILRGAAPPSAAREADDRHRQRVREASSSGIRPVYIYAATWLILMAWFFAPTGLVSDRVVIVRHIGAAIDWVGSTSLGVHKWIGSFLYAPHTAPSRPPNSAYCDCSGHLRGLVKYVDGPSLGWQFASDVPNKPIPNADIATLDKRIAAELIRIFDRDALGPILCMYETHREGTLYAEPVNVCVMSAHGSGDQMITMINMDIKGYSEDTIRVREANAMCKRKSGIYVRRSIVHIQYTTPDNRTINLRVDGIQESVHIQQHWEAMRGKYVCPSDPEAPVTKTPKQ